MQSQNASPTIITQDRAFLGREGGKGTSYLEETAQGNLYMSVFHPRLEDLDIYRKSNGSWCWSLLGF